jgi:hypothetical protein
MRGPGFIGLLQLLRAWHIRCCLSRFAAQLSLMRLPPSNLVLQLHRVCHHPKRRHSEPSGKCHMHAHAHAHRGSLPHHVVKYCVCGGLQQLAHLCQETEAVAPGVPRLGPVVQPSL